MSNKSKWFVFLRWQLFVTPLICAAFSFYFRYSPTWDIAMPFVAITSILMVPTFIAGLIYLATMLMNTEAKLPEKLCASIWLVLILPMCVLIDMAWRWIGLGLSGIKPLYLSLLFSFSMLLGWCASLDAIGKWRSDSLHFGYARRAFAGMFVSAITVIGFY